MKTININIYQFNELNEEGKQRAIENVRNSYYEYNDFLEWAVDNCALLEPPHKELITLFGDKYNFPLLKNNRKVYFSLDRGRYIDISDAMEIQDKEQFLTWLGLNKRLIAKVNYTIHSDSIEFENESENEFTAIEQNKLNEAEGKFHSHCLDILKCIESDYEYRFTDEAIIEDIEANEWDFLIDGSRYI